LVWNLTLDLSGLSDPASSYATAGIALEIIGARKHHRHDKAETPPWAGGVVISCSEKAYIYTYMILNQSDFYKHVLFYSVDNTDILFE
jgi:hypothetical protein